MQEAKLHRTRPLLLPSQVDAKLTLKELFATPSRPDALFSANNSSTIWVIDALRKMEMEIGKDVALVGFDDVDFYTLISPPITAVRQPPPN